MKWLSLELKKTGMPAFMLGAIEVAKNPLIYFSIDTDFDCFYQKFDRELRDTKN